MSFDLQQYFSAAAIRNPGTFERFDVIEAVAPGAIVFCELPDHVRRACLNPNVATILTTSGSAAGAEVPPAIGLVLSDQPRLAYWLLFNRLANEGRLRPALEYGRGMRCDIHPTAVVSDKCWIGDDVVIEAHASVGDYSIIGNGSLIGPGARIGAEGLQSVADGDRKMYIRHAGGVRLGARVVVLTNAIVSRGVHPVFTTVGDDTHLSLLSSVGHQSDIGRRCSIAGNCLIGGSVKMGDDVVLGPSVTIRDGVTIGARARLRIGSVVIENVPEDADLSGNFAVGHMGNLRRQTRIRHEST